MALPTLLPIVPRGLHHPAAGVAVLAGVLQDLEVDPQPLLARCGLPPEIAGAGQAVPVEREIAFIRLALERSGRSDLGLLAGRGHRFPVFGFWGLALAASPTLASAIRLGLQYVDLTHTFLRWRFERGGPEAALVMQAGAPLGELETFLVERDAAAAATLLEDLTGRRGGLAGAEFAYPAPARAARYDTVFGCRPTFGAGRHALRLSAAMLEQPLPGGDPVMAAAAEAQCHRLLEGLSPAGGLATRLRRHLLDHPGRLPTQDETARHLGLSRRSLRRRLAEEGTSFRALADEVRFGLVAGYLENTGLALDEIAARTGFSDAANLSHAFRRWTGTTPGTWRAGRRPGHASQPDADK
ncbi:AraC family transcriptional regulator [Wenzhouxiangella sp. XN24]|uniref:AraC family transcriptional regulator n=1 Tax=Wenzhouxiangella sp. XN24 TaxID=2713569 RepID=UPI0013EDC028|nr:AraC family transcriptional regulator [Wenzhouxiangella sp. XN24]NGX17234.1 AraC family transcriptional regulator [Wenzhouxiangella sp. XN24]